ncbi:hypothetical protein Hanom_Chr09g00762651 [Helianthus anomalus]
MSYNNNNNNPRSSVEQVFRDFKGRRSGIIQALTTDVESFFRHCDPEKENLCLYGFPSEQWEVNLPAEEVPSPFLIIPSCERKTASPMWAPPVVSM